MIISGNFLLFLCEESKWSVLYKRSSKYLPYVPQLSSFACLLWKISALLRFSSRSAANIRNGASPMNPTGV